MFDRAQDVGLRQRAGACFLRAGPNRFQSFVKLRLKKDATNPGVHQLMATKYTEDSRELTYVLEGGKVQSAVPAVTLHQLRGFSTSYRWHRVVQELPGFFAHEANNQCGTEGEHLATGESGSPGRGSACPEMRLQKLRGREVRGDRNGRSGSCDLPRCTN